MRSRFCQALLAALAPSALCLALVLPGSVLAQAAAPAASAAAPSPVISASARRLFDGVRHELVQVRTLLAQQDSQASVGSGFVVSEDGLIISNYHVVSQAALEPKSFRLRFQTADGRTGRLELLAIDVRRDLSLLRAVPDDGAKTWAKPMRFRPADEPLSKGDRIYSLGHPHDVAFAIVEGNYNGLVERSFDPLIYYAGGINPGMSGGPVLDEQGRVVGVNVSTMLFSQQMSFLIPGGFADSLLRRTPADAKPLTEPAWPQVREQLLAYGSELTQAFIAQPWRDWGHGRYRMPVPQEKFMRCWGDSTSADKAKGLKFERSQCRMDHALFINGRLQTGYLEIQHEVYDGSLIGPLRFARAYSNSFRNERLGFADTHQTAPHCTESFIDAQGLPLRAVVCLRAYRKMAGVHDVTVLLSAVDQPEQGLLGRFDARGVGFDDALKLARHFIGGYRLQPAAGKKVAP